MRLTRTDLFPVLTILAGGVIGASLSFSFLGSRSEDVPDVTLGLLYESSANPELAIRVEHPNVTAARIEADGMVIPPVVASYERATPDARRQALFRASQLARDRIDRAKEVQRLQERDLQERFEKEIEQVQTRYEEALGQKGRVDRVVTATDGVLGAGSAINIRGFSSIAIGNQPIIYVDGTRVEPPR